MVNLLLRWLLLTLIIASVPYIVSGVRVETFGAALAAAATLSILNLFLKPILVLLTLPFTLITFGLFLIVINALLFELAASIVSGFYVDSFWSAVIASILVSVVTSLMNWTSRSGNRVQFHVFKSGGAPSGGERKVRDLNPPE